MGPPEARSVEPQGRPDPAQVFRFISRRFDPRTGRVELRYELGDLAFCERITLPAAPIDEASPHETAIEAALDLLHWVAGVSYWKAACPDRIEFDGNGPDPWQADWLTRLYRKGLAEFAFENGLDSEQFPEFPSGPVRFPPPGRAALRRRTLVPMGGGKDSLVAWERLRALGEVTDSVQVGSAPLIQALGKQLPGQHWVIARTLDAGLVELNRRGALNGHVPVTAINTAILTLAALVLDYDRVAFANERSASQASRLDVRGREVNHQFSKSFEFETMLDDWVGRYVHDSLRVFSLLRRDRELAICRDFAALEQWHGQFSSCNRNFHLDGPRGQRWCGRCPKCVFVFLCLAPFMRPDRLVAIFGQDLLARSDLIDAFAALLAMDGVKPFECVGEADEARAAVMALSAQPVWAGHAVVRALRSHLEGVDVPSLDSLCEPGGPHRIPADLLDAA